MTSRMDGFAIGRGDCRARMEGGAKIFGNFHALLLA